MNRTLLPALVLFASASVLSAEIKVSKLFTPHMVLQREMAVPIWGTAAPGEKVTVKFRDQEKTTQADANGNWSVKLAALKSGGPDVLTIGEKKIDDVLVGDVWVGSGQSNMDMPVTRYTPDDPVLAEAARQTYPNLRLMKKGATDVWQVATPETISSFSALLFSFGHPLQKELNVPVGLMVGAVGGMPSGYWLSEEMYRTDAECAAAAKKFGETYDYPAEKAKYDALKAKYDEEMLVWKPLAEAAKKEGKQPPPAPKAPLAVAPAGECTTGKIGHLFESFIRPYVGYAIKGVLWDQGESRTAIVGVDQVTLMKALIKGWRKDWGQGDFPFLYVQKPSGGSPAWDPANPMTSKANAFAPQPRTLPFPPDPTYSYEAHLKIMNNPNTFMVTSTDLGPGVHPVNKSGYGARGAQTAMAAVYGKKQEIYGPLYAGHEVQGNKVRIRYTHTGKGLAVKHAPQLQGFLIAGEDKKFVWADAVIEGNEVVVSSPTVPAPKAVRYAWSYQFPWANLFNADGLPAQPFRTDEPASPETKD